ncbi:fasciclin domain-containing protein [Flavobacterium sp.]|uniref:fasciclin domain-containing protein n=1 Tax=Flavobacterium sp. TaxID=239 RepID=UPI002488D6FF|nr:fasciclin domain-containing protein [Flavobacterium sp.]MDI1317767.1 fasciclin domain-containing protein [Flavobacterium sp.]
MNVVKKISLFALVASLTVACGDGKKKDAEEGVAVDTTQVVVDTMAVEKSTTIVDVAAGNEDFTTLVAAVKAAGLVETLSSEGPFTVFAPTNEAFAKLPAGTVDNLLKPENVEKLKGLLTYHVVAGKFDAATVTDAITKGKGKYTVTTVQGGKIDLSIKDGKVVLTDANGKSAVVVMADVAASNGVIHAIDSVVMPK